MTQAPILANGDTGARAVDPEAVASGNTDTTGPRGVHAVEAAAADPSAGPAAPDNVHAGLFGERARQVRDAVRTWSGQLINLDGTNRLLFYRDLKVGTLDLAGAADTAVAALLAGRTVRLSVLFPGADHPGADHPGADHPGADHPARLTRARAIRNKSRELLEERGIATCFLAVGIATWDHATGTGTPAAPVVLRPATIAARGAAEEDFELSLSGDPEVNPTLLHLLAAQYGVAVDAEELLALVPEEGPFDVTALVAELARRAAAVPGFAVTPRLVLGTFSYAKLPMVSDLRANLEGLVAHDVIAAFAGNREAAALLRAGGGDVDIRTPDHTAPADEYLVLDSDSSQSYTINAAVAGQNLVVEGPPGTGKSQTIANLVATLVARGQRVLFVAEKRAAIAAVLDRLQQAGLGDLVLDLHDGAGSKRKIAQGLAATLRAAATIGLPDQLQLHEEVAAGRARLNAHDAAMHRVRQPWGTTMFDAQLALGDITAAHGDGVVCALRLPGAQLTRIDGGTARRLASELHEYAALGGLTLTDADSAWAGARIDTASQAEEALATADRLVTRELPAVRAQLDRVLRETALVAPSALADWRHLFALLAGVAATQRRFRPEVWGAPLAELAAATAPRSWRGQHPDLLGAGNGWWGRRRLRAHARDLTRSGDTDGLHEALLTALQQRQLWAQAAVDGGLPRLPAEAGAAGASFELLGRVLVALGAPLAGTPLTALDAPALELRLARLAHDDRTLRRLPRLNELAASLAGAGLGPLLAELRRRRAAPELAAATFGWVWTSSVLDRIGFEDPVVAAFDGALHSATVARFAAADARHVQATSARVRRAVSEQLVTARDAYPDQARVVEAEAVKKSRHLPLRRLFAAAPEVLTALKPCWAMSPLVVSQLLPGDRPYFDVVVFDEASQILPADAVPAILRARRIVVAGDAHQLPPTSFFTAAGEGAGDGPTAVAGPETDGGSIDLSLTTGYESVLDVATAGLGVGRVKHLNWHYRSRDERLIAFSNAWIYAPNGNDLTTFPGVAGRGCLAHELVGQHRVAAPAAPAYAPADAESATAEVRRVVELVLEHAAVRPDESLGVITMGIKHAERIDLALRAALAGRPELHAFFDDVGAERFFVKNLERVQGDERDAVILSIGYGKNADGRVSYRFGPLLQAGGERRLNVAITRARSRMTLVSSFSQHDLDPARCAAPGVAMLRGYLQYADSGGERLAEDGAGRPVLNAFEADVCDRLTAAGVPVTPQYGVAGYWIDFAAAHPDQPGRMVLAIEADGASYHSSPTARDRDRLRQEQLERLGWRFSRIWSTDWFADPEACVARVREDYDTAVAEADEDLAAAGAAQAAADLVAAEQARAAERAAAERVAAAMTAERPALQATARRSVAPQEVAAPTADSAALPAAAVRGPRPAIIAGKPVTGYRPAQLAALISWIESDSLLRTAEEVREAWLAELGFCRRGSRIDAAFDRALAEARG